MKIRKFRKTDSGSLATLYFQTIRRINIRDYTQAQVEAWAPAERDMEKWERSFDGKAVFVAEEQGKILGFGELETNGHIDKFYVAADRIGRGVGRKIYADIERQAVQWKISRLFVEASITAKPFFERMGFSAVREQTVLARGTPLNNFVMEKLLIG